VSFKNHIKGARAEAIVAAHLINLGYYVFTPVVNMQGPVDIMAIDDDGNFILIDAKHEGKRASKGRPRKTRIHRVRTPTQKKLGVRIAYVTSDDRVDFVPKLE
jgi:hypothetical protein|tara:strand:+ start:557 stop:865 length:309 start_codon:yes stop_codon:yes gene_type:complete